MLIIKNSRVVNPAENMDGLFDIAIEGERITEIAPQGMLQTEAGNDQIIDGTGWITAPGLVDVHVHFRDPGLTYKEDIETGAKAAAKGGFTTVVLMANTKPVVDNEETLAYVLEKGRKTDIHVESCVNVTKGMKGEELVDVEALLKVGAVGITDDGVPLLDEELARRAMDLSARFDVPISFHEEDPAYIENNGVNRGKASAHFGIGGSDRMAEISLVKRDLELALETGANMNVQHISSKEAVELVRQAKKRPGGERIHAEATPHHFALTEDAVCKYGTLAKMNPPLREEEDRRAIVEGIADGTIDLIATDHAPHSKEEKEKSITEAPSGIIGLETALSLAIEYLAENGEIPYSTIISAMSVNPARLYHLPAGSIKEGEVADLVLFDPAATWKAEQFVSKSSNSPFLGRTMRGKVCYTICEGRIIYKQS